MVVMRIFSLDLCLMLVNNKPLHGTGKMWYGYRSWIYTYCTRNIVCNSTVKNMVTIRVLVAITDKFNVRNIRPLHKQNKNKTKKITLLREGITRKRRSTHHILNSARHLFYIRSFQLQTCKKYILFCTEVIITRFMAVQYNFWNKF